MFFGVLQQFCNTSPACLQSAKAKILSFFLVTLLHDQCVTQNIEHLQHWQPAAHANIGVRYRTQKTYRHVKRKKTRSPHLEVTWLHLKSKKQMKAPAGEGHAPLRWNRRTNQRFYMRPSSLCSLFSPQPCSACSVSHVPQFITLIIVTIAVTLWIMNNEINDESFLMFKTN